MDSLTSIIDRSLLRQVLAISPVLIYAISQEMLWYLPSLALSNWWTQEPELRVNEPNAMVNLNRIITAADVGGCIISAILMKYIGRRITHRIFTAAGAIAILIVWFAPNIPALRAGSTFVGLSIGGSNYLGCIMIGEYASPKYRGAFLYLKNFLFLIGTLNTVLIRSLVSYTTIAMMALAPLVISFAIIQITPESPMWLASRKKYKESEKVFYKLRGENTEANKEIRELIETQMSYAAETKEKNLCENILTFLSKFISSGFLKPFGIIVIAIVVLEFSGRNYLATNPGPIAFKFTFDLSVAFDIRLAHIMMSASAFISVILIKLCRQRVLLFSTGSLACFILVLVLFFSAIIPVRRPVIIDTLLCIYCFLINLGCSPLPLVLVGELFPLEHKGVGMAATGIVSHIYKYAMEQLTYNILLQSFNIRWMLLIYSAVTSVCLLILYYILPETRARTLQDIEKKLEKQIKSHKQANLQSVKLCRVSNN